MNPTLETKRLDKNCLNPLGIGEGFEQLPGGLLTILLRLNPLGIGEGFELNNIKLMNKEIVGLNPLGIGEGFELQSI